MQIFNPTEIIVIIESRIYRSLNKAKELLIQTSNTSFIHWAVIKDPLKDDEGKNISNKACGAIASLFYIGKLDDIVIKCVEIKKNINETTGIVEDKIKVIAGKKVDLEDVGASFI